MVKCELVRKEDVGWVRVLTDFLDPGLEAIEVYIGIKLSQVLLVVGFGVKLKHTDIKLLDVFEIHFQSYFLIDSKDLLVSLIELEQYFIRDSPEQLQRDIRVLERG